MKRIAFCIALFSSMVMAPPAVRAGSFSVNPVRLEMAPTQNATALTVSNFGSEPQLLQVRVYRWTHAAGEELLTEVEGSEAPIITPPLFRLAANGGAQVVRIGFQKPAVPATEEREWRVIVEEVPKPAQESAADASPNPSASPIEIALRLRVSLPLFQRPPTVRQDLVWTLEPALDGHLRLGAQNLGSVTERVDEILLGPASDKNGRLTGPFYLFPGERRNFELRPETALPAGPVKLSLQGTPRPLVRDLVFRAQ